jgi:hemoglobin
MYIICIFLESPMHAQITDAALADLVGRFYAKARRDPLIGPLFERAVEDWPAHLAKLSDFWSSVMLTSGRYKGNPVAEHLKHANSLDPSMFERWLALWRETTAETFAPEAAARLQEKAGRIAESLQLALRFHQGKSTLAARPVSREPYRSTPEFDQDTLPAGLRRDHRTKAGTWGVIRVLEGRLRLHWADPPATRELAAGDTAVVAPEQTHWVEPVGPMRMRVDFHDAPPVL